MTTKTNLLMHAALVAAFVSVTGLAHSQSNRAAITKNVAGPVTLTISGVNASMEARAHNAKTISISITDATAAKITIVKKGKGYQVRFDGAKHLRSGKVKIHVPAGSELHLTSVSGDMKLLGVGGVAKVRSVSGDLIVQNATSANVATVSGDITMGKISGSVTAKSVSGDISVKSTGKVATKLRTSTTSGNVSWSGRCGKGCNLRLNTLSGSLRLELNKASSFKLNYSSFSGSFKDGLGINTSNSKANKHGGSKVSGSYGSGAGKIRARSFSGRLKLQKK